MAFESLTDKLQNVFKNLRKKGRLTEADVKSALKEVKMALLEADVSFKVVKQFMKSVQERAVGQDVMSGLNPGQMVIKIVNEELCNLMGSETTEIKLQPGSAITVIMMAGLQGAGKTTTTAKLAGKFKLKGKKPLLVACDVYRPAAIKQLQINGEKQGVEVFTMGDGHKPVNIAKAAVEHFKEDFVYKIRSAIKEAYVRRDELNRIIRNLNFGKDRYQFKITRNKGADGAFYDMFMDEDLEIDPSSLASPVEHQMNLFSMEHENKYGMLMSELIRIFIPPENASQQELDEAKQNMVKYADYRTYLSFEMEQIVEGDERLVIGLSKMIKKNSGGEGQNPLYIALLASFAQAYHINLSARLTRRPTIRLVVLDEAYMDFWDQSLLREAAQYDNLIILRTCSKAIGLAGIRLGFAVANEMLTRVIRSVKSPYNVNSVSQALGCVAFSHPEQLRRNIERLIVSREALYRLFQSLAADFPGKVEIVRPVTNFVWAKCERAGELFDALKRQGIIVRRMGEYLRVTAGRNHENEKAADAIRFFYTEKG